MNFITIQMFEAESSTFTYLLVDRSTCEAVLIDPVIEQKERDSHILKELNLKLVWLLETHIHADHITSAGPMRELTGAPIGLSEKAGIKDVDRQLKEGDKIQFGASELCVWETPGHTKTCLSYVADGVVFCGDALLIRGTGRTDFQEGDAGELYDSVTKKLFTLPEQTIVYPAHNYKGIHSTTIEWEKKFNPRLKLGTSREEFIATMSELNLPYPKKIDQALPGNLKLGL